jgi:uncharacterized protein (TIGR02444 family)
MANFWNFSLGLYGRPGVAPACIALQDGYGLDVNLVLFCCWHGQANRRLGQEDLRRAIGAAEAWQREVVQPLRAVRRRLKAGVSPISAIESEALRRKVNDLELEGERIAQAALESLPAPAAGRRPAVAENLALYLTMMGREPERVAELTVLSEACA